MPHLSPRVPWGGKNENNTSSASRGWRRGRPDHLDAGCSHCGRYPPPTASPPVTRWPCERMAWESRYGATIRSSASPPAHRTGQHVHVHNIGMGDFAKDYAFCPDAEPTDYIDPPATFEGIRRSDGRVATRNYIGILTSRELQRARGGHGRGCVQAQSLHGIRASRRLSQRGWRGGADPQDRLRHVGRRTAEPAAPHACRLCPPSELFPRHRAGPGLRGEPDRRPDPRNSAWPTGSATWTSNPWAAPARRSRPA